MPGENTVGTPLIASGPVARAGGHGDRGRCCDECGNVRYLNWDRGIIRRRCLCRLAGQEMSREHAQRGPVPPWCPLPKKEGK